MITKVCEPCNGTGKESEGSGEGMIYTPPEQCKECKGRGNLVTIEEDDFVYVSLDKVNKPKDAHMDILLNRWWCVHPEKGLAFFSPKGRNGKRRSGHGNPYGSPQCNKDKRISDRLNHEWMEVQFIEVVYLPLIMQDYMH